MKSYNIVNRKNDPIETTHFRPNSIFEIDGRFYRNPMGYTQAAIGKAHDTLWDDDLRVVQAKHMECIETDYRVSPRYRAGDTVVKVSENGEVRPGNSYLPTQIGKTEPGK